MARKKGQITTKRQSNKRTEAEKSEETKKSVSEMFISESKDSPITEEDIKEFEEEKAARIELEKSANEVTETEDETPAENPSVETVVEGREVYHVPFLQEVKDEAETVSSDEGVSSYTCTSYSITVSNNGEETVTATSADTEAIVSDGAEVVVQEETKPEKPKKRKTTKDIYGYHWMGMIFD